jgi:hypothetical protein
MNELKTEYVELSFSNGILCGRYLPNKIDLKAAQEIVAARKAFSNNKPYPVLADTRMVTKVTKEAREYLSSPEGIAGVLAGAIISDSTFSAFLANFFLKVSKPPIPTRIFTDRHEALAWLSRFKQ